MTSCLGFSSRIAAACAMLLGAPAFAANFTVTTEAELAQAIADANANPGADAIFIDTPDGIPTVITLTAPLPWIAGDLEITGEGADMVRISGDGLFRVFFVEAGDVTFRNLTVGDGVSLGFDGGGSTSAGGGGSPGVGGGIYVRSGRTFLENMRIDNCHAIGGNGGSIGAGGDGGGGGAGFDGNGNASVGNVGGDGGASGDFEGVPGTGGLESDGVNNPHGFAGGLGAGGGGGGAAIDPFAGGFGGAGGYLAGGGGGGRGSATRIPGHGAPGGFGAGGGGAGRSGGFGVANAGTSSGLGGLGGRSLNEFGNGGGGGAGMGGGLFVDGPGTATTINVTFSNNTSTGGAGGLGGDGGRTEDDGVKGLGKGGAVFIASGSILAFDGQLIFDNNSASDAGPPGGFDNPNTYGPLVALIPDTDSGGGGGGGCFIATAAYGTPMEQNVETLRAFRDEYLLTNAVGLAFADAYYAISPQVADWVSASPELAALVRLVLTPIVWICALLLTPLAPVAFALGIGVLAFSARKQLILIRRIQI